MRKTACKEKRETCSSHAFLIGKAAFSAIATASIHFVWLDTLNCSSIEAWRTS